MLAITAARARRDLGLRVVVDEIAHNGAEDVNDAVWIDAHTEPAGDSDAAGELFGPHGVAVAQRDLNKLVKHDETVNIGNDRTKTVGRDDSLAVGDNRSKTVSGTERNVVSVNQSVAVGVNRSTQVGRIDSPIVGEMHTVMVMPPGEGGAEEHLAVAALTSDSVKISLMGGGGPSITMYRKTSDTSASIEVVSGEGGASITLIGDSILFDAVNVNFLTARDFGVLAFGTATLHGAAKANLLSDGEVVIQSEMVSINPDKP